MTLGQKHLLRILMAIPGRWYPHQKLLPAAEDAESIAGAANRKFVQSAGRFIKIHPFRQTRRTTQLLDSPAIFSVPLQMSVFPPSASSRTTVI
jgi:hypothetical protein